MALDLSGVPMKHHLRVFRDFILCKNRWLIDQKYLALRDAGYNNTLKFRKQHLRIKTDAGMQAIIIKGLLKESLKIQ